MKSKQTSEPLVSEGHSHGALQRRSTRSIPQAMFDLAYCAAVFLLLTCPSARLPYMLLWTGPVQQRPGLRDRLRHERPAEHDSGALLCGTAKASGRKRFTTQVRQRHLRSVSHVQRGAHRG